ncbi:MAG: hypothetical protein QGH45_22410, partial [Myxococcota bacterium]|nr:hypothetical protein [Myxococcota bacterium]
VWIGDLTFAGRAVRLLGPFGPTKTVISGHGSAPVVLFNTQEGADSVLEGFTIRDGGGYAGAGILMMETGPTLRSLIIRDNVADQGDGGGLAGTAATPSLTNVSILDNSSSHGGGAYLQHDSVATMTNVWIASNTAGVDGGGLQVTADSVLVLENGILAGNTAQLRGGGLALDSGAEAHFTNVAVVGNTAVFQGGGLWVHSDAVAQLTNTEISANHCGGEGGGLKVDAWPGVVFRYTNLHDNLPQDLVGQSDPVGQNGNVAVNPEFLKSAPSDPIDWDLHVQPWSPLVDAGDPARADPDGSTSDIGTFGGPEATSWDLDGDGFPVWWLPGAYDAATSPGMDCDDGDPQVFPLSGC